MHNDRLVPLESLPDFHVAEGYTDIRGFDAFLSDGEQVGRVRQLLVDPDAQRVAAVTLHGLGAGDGVQVPIEDVEIDTSSRRVMIQGAELGTVGTRERATGAEGMAAGPHDLGRREAVASEELVVRTGQVRETRTVEADLRRERAEVIEHGDVRAGGTASSGDTGRRADNPLRGGRDLDGDGVR